MCVGVYVCVCVGMRVYSRLNKTIIEYIIVYYITMPFSGMTSRARQALGKMRVRTNINQHDVRTCAGVGVCMRVNMRECACISSNRNHPISSSIHIQVTGILYQRSFIQIFFSFCFQTVNPRRIGLYPN